MANYLSVCPRSYLSTYIACISLPHHFSLALFAWFNKWIFQKFAYWLLCTSLCSSSSSSTTHLDFVYEWIGCFFVCSMRKTHTHTHNVINVIVVLTLDLFSLWHYQRIESETHWPIITICNRLRLATHASSIISYFIVRNLLLLCLLVIKQLFCVCSKCGK